MVTPPVPAEAGSPPAWLRFEYANENRQATIALGGTGVAILTFLLVFFYGRFASGGLDSILFRATLATIVVSIFLLGIAGSYYYFLIEALEGDRGRTVTLLRRADGCFVGGILLLLVEPALILFTLAIYDVGTLAAGLWVVSMVLIITERRSLDRGLPKPTGRN